MRFSSYYFTMPFIIKGTIIIKIYLADLTISDKTRFLVEFILAVEEERSFMKFSASLFVANFLYIDPGNLRT